MKTPRARINHTDIAGSRFRIANSRRAGGGRRVFRTAQVLRSYFLSTSPFSLTDRSWIRPLGRRGAATTATATRTNLVTESERGFSRFTTARGLLVHRESPFSPGTGPRRRREQRQALLTRRSPRYCDRARPVRGRLRGLASRASARTVRAASPRCRSNSRSPDSTAGTH